MRTSNTAAATLTSRFTFAEIDQKISALKTPETAALLTPTADPMTRLTTTYVAVRPILLTILALPLLPPSWRAVLKMFITNLDALATAFDPTFKAGKDQ